MDTLEALNRGEKWVSNLFTTLGYETNHNTQTPDHTIIEVIKNTKVERLIHVKTALYPNEPPELTPIELADIKLRAAKIGATAYHAKVQIDHLGLLTRRLDIKKV